MLMGKGRIGEKLGQRNLMKQKNTYMIISKLMSLCNQGMSLIRLVDAEGEDATTHKTATFS